MSNCGLNDGVQPVGTSIADVYYLLMDIAGHCFAQSKPSADGVSCDLTQADIDAGWLRINQDGSFPSASGEQQP
jgi:hypothetical protein